MTEGRKLQLAGGTTYMISLPRRWVLSHQLRPGDTLYVDQIGDSITFRAQGTDRAPTRTMEIDAPTDGPDAHLLRNLIAAYIAGYGVVHLRFPPGDGTSARRVAREFCRLVTGPVIVEEDRAHVTIQDLSDAAEVNAGRYVRRMHAVVRAMLSEAVDVFLSGDTARAGALAEREREVDRLYWMVAKRHRFGAERSTASPTAADEEAFRAFRPVAKLLERTGDQAVRIARTRRRGKERAARPEGEPARELRQLTEQVIALLDDAVLALASGDATIAHRTIDGERACGEALRAFGERLSEIEGTDLLAWTGVLGALDRAAGDARDVAEQAVDVAVDRGPA